MSLLAGGASMASFAAYATQPHEYRLVRRLTTTLRAATNELPNLRKIRRNASFASPGKASGSTAIPVSDLCLGSTRVRAVRFLRIQGASAT